MADKKCSRCNGNGKEPNDVKLGHFMRGRRKHSNIGLREMASRIGVSAGYLTNLEKGNRHWSPELISKFDKQLRMATVAAKVSSKSQQKH